MTSRPISIPAHLLPPSTLGRGEGGAQKTTNHAVDSMSPIAPPPITARSLPPHLLPPGISPPTKTSTSSAGLEGGSGVGMGMTSPNADLLSQRPQVTTMDGSSFGSAPDLRSKLPPNLLPPPALTGLAGLPKSGAPGSSTGMLPNASTQTTSSQPLPPPAGMLASLQPVVPPAAHGTPPSTVSSSQPALEAPGASSTPMQSPSQPHVPRIASAPMAPAPPSLLPAQPPPQPQLWPTPATEQHHPRTQQLHPTATPVYPQVYAGYPPSFVQFARSQEVHNVNTHVPPGLSPIDSLPGGSSQMLLPNDPRAIGVQSSSPNVPTPGVPASAPVPLPLPPAPSVNVTETFTPSDATPQEAQFNQAVEVTDTVSAGVHPVQPDTRLSKHVQEKPVNPPSSEEAKPAPRSFFGGLTSRLKSSTQMLARSISAAYRSIPGSPKVTAESTSTGSTPSSQANSTNSVAPSVQTPKESDATDSAVPTPLSESLETQVLPTKPQSSLVGSVPSDSLVALSAPGAGAAPEPSPPIFMTDQKAQACKLPTEAHHVPPSPVSIHAVHPALPPNMMSLRSETERQPITVPDGVTPGFIGDHSTRAHPSLSPSAKQVPLPSFPFPSSTVSEQKLLGELHGGAAASAPKSSTIAPQPNFPTLQPEASQSTSPNVGTSRATPLYSSLSHEKDIGIVSAPQNLQSAISGRIHHRSKVGWQSLPVNPVTLAKLKAEGIILQRKRKSGIDGSKLPKVSTERLAQLLAKLDIEQPSQPPASAPLAPLALASASHTELNQLRTELEMLTNQIVKLAHDRIAEQLLEVDLLDRIENELTQNLIQTVTSNDITTVSETSERDTNPAYIAERLGPKVARAMWVAEVRAKQAELSLHAAQLRIRALEAREAESREHALQESYRRHVVQRQVRDVRGEQQELVASLREQIQIQSTTSLVREKQLNEERVLAEQQLRQLIDQLASENQQLRAQLAALNLEPNPASMPVSQAYSSSGQTPAMPHMPLPQVPNR